MGHASAPAPTVAMAPAQQASVPKAAPAAPNARLKNPLNEGAAFTMTLVDVPNNFSPGRNNAQYRDAFDSLCKPAYKRVLGPPNVGGFLL
jgi:hypothetical protein